MWRLSRLPPSRAIAYWRQQGLRALIERAIAKLRRERVAIGPADGYARWAARYQTLAPRDRRAIAAEIARMREAPLISIILAPPAASAKFLAATLQSLRDQLYPHWECHLPDGFPLSDQDRAEARFQSSPEWRPSGAWVVHLRPDDLLAPHALYMLAVESRAYPEAGMIYSDEDRIDEAGTRSDPYFKPDWDAELFYGRTYIDALCAVRRDLLDALPVEAGWSSALLLRTVEKLRPDQIRHIPMVLYHRRIGGANEVEPAAEAREARLDHFARRGITVEVTELQGLSAPEPGWRIHYPLSDPPPLVSVIIPTRDKIDLLRVCVDGLLEDTDYPALEIIIIDNDSVERESLDYFQRIAERGVRVLRIEGPFNYSAIHNRAVEEAQGPLLALLNNDLKIIHRDWLREMVSHAIRPEIGAVGAKLYFPDDRIQHAGILFGVFGGAGHIHHRLPREISGNRDDLRLTHAVGGVTGACLVLRRSLYREVGGFDAERFKIVFNDVDLCLKIRAKGLINLWTPFAELYHYESATRGQAVLTETILRENRERAILRQIWGAELLRDPAYNPNLTDASVWCSLATPPRVKKPWS